MTETAAVISDPLRVPILAEKRDHGGVVIRRGQRFIALGSAELDRLMEFAQVIDGCEGHAVPLGTC